RSSSHGARRRHRYTDRRGQIRTEENKDAAGVVVPAEMDVCLCDVRGQTGIRQRVGQRLRVPIEHQTDCACAICEDGYIGTEFVKAGKRSGKYLCTCGCSRKHRYDNDQKGLHKYSSTHIFLLWRNFSASAPREWRRSIAQPLAVVCESRVNLVECGIA